MTQIIIVNGPPRAGKDTFIEILTAMLRAKNIDVDAFSSIDPVRDMLTGAGFDLSKKTQADRRLLALVGDAVEEHSAWRTQQCIDRITDFAFSVRRPSESVMFLHIREPANIATIRQWASATYGVHTCSTVFIENFRAEQVTSNAADAGVKDMGYDYTLENNGTLDDLLHTTRDFADSLFPDRCRK